MGVLVVAAAAVAACGGGGGAADSQSQGLTGTPIKIGVPLATTGLNSQAEGPAGPAAEAWAKWTNAHGGIDGRPVQVITADTSSTPATAATVVRDLVDKQKVSALMLADYVSEGALGPYIAQKNVPVIGVMGFDKTVWTGKPQFLATATTNPTLQLAYLSTANASGAKHVALAACAEAPSCMQSDAMLTRLAQGQGLAYDGVVKVSASSPNFTAECLTFADRGSQFVATSLTSAVAVRMASDCLRQGYHGSFGVMGGAVVLNQLDQAAGAKYAGIIGGFPWWIDDPKVQVFRDAMKQYAPETDIRNAWVTSAWTSLELFKKALTGKAGTGEVTPQQVFDAYYALNGETLGGLLPQPVTYTRDQPAPQVRCYWYYTYTVGDDHPKVLHTGRAGNGASGDLASSCYDGPS